MELLPLPPTPLLNSPYKPTFPALNHHRAKYRTSRPTYSPESTKSIHTSQFWTSSNLPALSHKAGSGLLSPLAPSISPAALQAWPLLLRAVTLASPVIANHIIRAPLASGSLSPQTSPSLCPLPHTPRQTTWISPVGKQTFAALHLLYFPL